MKQLLFGFVVLLILSLKCETRTTPIDPIDTVIIKQIDTVFIPRIDTLIQVDTLIKWKIQTDTVVRVDTLVRMDTVFLNRVDTIFINSIDTVFVPRIDTIFIPRIDTVFIRDTVCLDPPKKEVDTVEVLGYNPMHQWKVRSNKWRTDSSAHYGKDTSTYWFYGHQFFLYLKSDGVSSWMKVLIDGEDWMDINMKSSEVYYWWFHGPVLHTGNHRVDLVPFGDGSGAVRVGFKYVFLVDPNLYGVRPEGQFSY